MSPFFLKFGKRSGALLSALLLTACVDAPPTTPQVSEIKQNDLGLTGEAAPHAPHEWWKAFNDPQADRLAGMVVASNPTLTAAMARMRAAQAELAVNRAQDLPQVTLNGSEQRVLFSKDYIIPPPYGGSYRWYGALTADLSWNLDFWGKQADLIEKARNTAQAAALDVEGAHLALSGAFAQAYINLLLNYQYGDIADATVAEREEILKITQGRFNAGLENGSAVEQAKSLLSIAKADQLRFAAAREMDIHAISALAGQGAGLYQTITRPKPNLDVALPLPQRLPADLLARRPDILAAKARVEAGSRAARRRMPISIPTSIWRRWWDSRPSACPTSSPVIPSPWGWDRRCICRFSMPASCALNMPALPPISIWRLPIIMAPWWAPSNKPPTP